MTMWFETIVDTAIAATMTIEVADENPPRNESIASPSRSNSSGRVSTNRSGFAPEGITLSPIAAIGSTNRLIRNRYSGNAQLAVARWRSSDASTTMT